MQEIRVEAKCGLKGYSEPLRTGLVNESVEGVLKRELTEHCGYVGLSRASEYETPHGRLTP